MRHGRLLGRREPFLGATAEVVIETMGDAYPILRERREVIIGTIIREEAAFARTLDAGTTILEEALRSKDNPILLRVETKAGHGAGKPTSKQIEENADLYGFAMERLQMPLGPPPAAAP